MYAILIKIIEAILPAFIPQLINKIRGVKKSRKIKDLQNHDVFNTLGRVRGEVGMMKFYTNGEYDKVKSRMCYDFTKFKALKCYSKMTQILEVKDIDTMSKNKLKKLILEEQHIMHREYIKDIKQFWKMKGIKPKDVDYVIHLFEKFRYDVIVSFEHRINSIFGSSYNEDNFAIMLAVLEMWAMGIDLLPRDMQTTFESLNGKFKDIKYLK